MDSWIKYQVARQCLSEIGWDDRAIAAKIADWITSAGYDCKVESVPPEAIEYLANAMQKRSEVEFCAMVGSVAA